jgi:hypothetical protein
MLSIYDLKELAVTDTPLLLFQCLLQNGQAEYWSTHQVTYAGNTYAPLVMKHNVFAVQTSSDQGVDSIPRVSLSMANADSYFSELERSVGWKGATLTVTFLFYNLLEGEATSDAAVLFQGIVNPPDQSTESLFQLSAVNWMSMQNVQLPPVRIQRRCPWLFPSNAQQRQEAVSGGNNGTYSLFYACGYSPDQTRRRGLHGRRRTVYILRAYAHGLRSARHVFRAESLRRTRVRAFVHPGSELRRRVAVRPGG